MRVLLLEVLQKSQKGPQLMVSRVRPLVPEAAIRARGSGNIQRRCGDQGIARESGMRSKVAVAARQANVDPVGSCVGMKGQRIQKIVDEFERRED